MYTLPQPPSVLLHCETEKGKGRAAKNQALIL
jgi:hypothetical protein